VGVSFAHILAPEEALMVRAKEGFEEVIGKKKRNRKPGDRWLVYGPGEYFPPIQIQVLEMRKALLRLEFLNIYMFYSPFSFILFIIMALVLSFAIPRRLGYL